MEKFKDNNPKYYGWFVIVDGKELHEFTKQWSYKRLLNIFLSSIATRVNHNEYQLYSGYIINACYEEIVFARPGYHGRVESLTKHSSGHFRSEMGETYLPGFVYLVEKSGIPKGYNEPEGIRGTDANQSMYLEVMSIDRIKQSATGVESKTFGTVVGSCHANVVETVNRIYNPLDSINGVMVEITGPKYKGTDLHVGINGVPIPISQIVEDPVESENFIVIKQRVGGRTHIVGKASIVQARKEGIPIEMVVAGETITSRINVYDDEFEAGYRSNYIRTSEHEETVRKLKREYQEEINKLKKEHLDAEAKRRRLAEELQDEKKKSWFTRTVEAIRHLGKLLLEAFLALRK